MAYKLLLADDSQTIQKVVELVLNREGFDILACSDGEEALKSLGTGMPDIVLADIEMPKMNGYQLCEKIKGNPATVHIPVILLAGAFEPFDEDYARSVGADDFIMKPFESHELVSKVNSLLMAPAQAVAEVQVPAVEKPTVVEPIVEEPVLAGAAAAPAADESRWFESFTVDQPELVKPFESAEHVAAAESGKTKSFDEELQESIEKLDEKGLLEPEKSEEAAPELSSHEIAPQDDISIDEISKMVKEAMTAPEEHMPAEPVEHLYSAAVPVEHHELAPAAPVIVSHEEARPAAAISREEINAAVMESISSILPSVVRESVDRAVTDTVPNLLEEALRQTINEMSGHIRSAINDEIKKVVPGLADAIIKREIEKITSELT